LNRQQQAFWAAAEAELIGYGGCRLLARVTGIAPATIAKRKRQFSVTGSAAAGSLIPKRSAGAGRKVTEVNHPEIEPALQQMLSEEIAGDPMSTQRWVRSSLRNLSKRLGEQGHQACTHTVARLLRKMGYSLQVAKKKQAGAQHPDRDEQFKYIAVLKAEFLTKKLPVISIDTKKKRTNWKLSA
jgi:transposase